MSCTNRPIPSLISHSSKDFAKEELLLDTERRIFPAALIRSTHPGSKRRSAKETWSEFLLVYSKYTEPGFLHPS